MKKNNKKLPFWQARLENDALSYADEMARMDQRERLYSGSREVHAVIQKDSDRGGGPKKATHVRNIVSELIESQVDSSLPMPKVTPMYKEDEELARLIEDMLRNEMDRLPFEMLNDMAERTVPIQGGGYYLVDWDDSKRTHTTVGELAVSFLHPKMVVPQDGVWTSIEDMDYFFVQTAQTKDYILARYGKDVYAENESDPDVRGVDPSTAEDMVTLNVAYYRNGRGGIGRYAWVNNIELEDIEDYQCRQIRKCVDCGRPEPLDADNEVEPVVPDYGQMELAGLLNYSAVAASTAPQAPERCPYCGGKYQLTTDEYEEIWQPITRRDGTVLGPQTALEVTGFDEQGQPITEMVTEPLRIPFYKPDAYPLVLQRNISVYGQLLGDSDVDKIADQQNTINILSAKINDKLMTGGSYVVLPKDSNIKTNSQEMKCIYPKNQADANMIRVVTAQADVQADMYHMAEVYEEARQIIGITDSYQGRRDTTAISGKAKQFAAAQSAGRLQSKRVTKNAAWAQLFELMFKFKLAYADEPRPVISRDGRNVRVYHQFNRYDFLKQDATGEWYWNDRFLFSVDDSSALAVNREAMWQETLNHLRMGAFGDPTNLDTLIAYWAKMEQLHYPAACETKEYLIEQQQMQAELLAQQQAQAQQQAMAQAQQQAMAQAQQQATAQAQQQATAQVQQQATGLSPELLAVLQQGQLTPQELAALAARGSAEGVAAANGLRSAAEGRLTR